MLAATLSLLLALTPVAPADTQRTLPPTVAARARSVDVRHLAIDLRFDWQKQQAYGTTAITLAPMRTTDHITLDAGMLTIGAITLQGGPALAYQYDGGDRDDGLGITLDRVYQAGESLTLVIAYRTNRQNRADPNSLGGTFGKGLRFLQPTRTTPTRRRQIWSMGSPTGNRYWFPGYDGPNDLRTTELTATVEPPLIAVSNGTLVETRQNSDGTRSYHYRMPSNYPNNLTSLVVGEYDDVRQTAGALPLHTFGYPDERAAVEATVVRLPDMVKFLEDRTGATYPFASYAQVAAQDFAGGAAHSGASTVTDNMIDDYRTHKDFYLLWDGQEAHVLASQWFGSLLSIREWRDIWLNESFSHYMDGRYTEYRNGRAEYLLFYYPFDHDVSYLADWQAGYRHPIVTRQISSIDTFTTDNYALRRGALVLRMLEHELGEARWWRGVQHYVAANAGRQVSTEDFRVAMEESTGESLEWFFDQWLYRIGHPVFAVRKAYDPTRQELTLTVTQTQTPDSTEPYPQVRWFQGKVDIEIDDRVETVRLEPVAVNRFTFPMAAPPRLVTFDYESVWIKELDFPATLDELLYQLEHDRDVVARWRAIDRLGAMAGDSAVSTADRARVRGGLRQLALSDAYWRLRIKAMVQLRSLQAPPLDPETLAMLQTIIARDSALVRTSALTSLGATADPRYAPIYLAALADTSDRVINAAAIALGRSRSPKAFDALARLPRRPSWKSQSLISALNGLKALGDPRGADIALRALADVRSPRWWLAVSAWDYPITATETLVALGAGKRAYPMLRERFQRSLEDGDDHDIFSNLLLLTTLADPRGEDVYGLLRTRYRDDPNALNAVAQYESQFKNAVKPR